MAAKALIYLRVSTDEQVDSGLSLADQEARCRAYCAMRGLEVAEVARDAGVSGGKALETRPGRARVLSLTSGRRPGVARVVTLKLDRTFRNAADCLTVTAYWDRRGVVFHLVDFGGASLDLSSAMGRMFLTMSAGFAELERGLVSERTKAALAVKRVRQEFCGGGAPFGWRVEEGRLVEDREEQAVLALIRELRGKGCSFQAIADELNERRMPNRGAGTWHRARVFTLHGRLVA